jgi:predicted kinase
MMAIRAEVFRFIVFTEPLVKLKQVITDLASKLRPFITVIVVDVDMRGIAERTESLRRDFGRIRAVLNRRKRFTVSSLVLSQEEFVILWLRGLPSNGRLS